MSKKIVRWIILVVLLICTAFIVNSIVTDPLDVGVHEIIPALAIAAGFIALGNDKDKK